MEKMMNNIVFVPAKASDAATISTLRQRIWDTTYRGVYPDAVIDDFDYDWHQQCDLKKISDPSVLSAIAVLTMRMPCGFISVWAVWW